MNKVKLSYISDKIHSLYEASRMYMLKDPLIIYNIDISTNIAFVLRNVIPGNGLPTEIFHIPTKSILILHGKIGSGGYSSVYKFKIISSEIEQLINRIYAIKLTKCESYLDTPDASVLSIIRHTKNANLCGQIKAFTIGYTYNKNSLTNLSHIQIMPYMKGDLHRDGFEKLVGIMSTLYHYDRVDIIFIIIELIRKQVSCLVESSINNQYEHMLVYTDLKVANIVWNVHKLPNGGLNVIISLADLASLVPAGNKRLMTYPCDNYTAYTSPIDISTKEDISTCLRWHLGIICLQLLNINVKSLNYKNVGTKHKKNAIYYENLIRKYFKNTPYVFLSELLKSNSKLNIYISFLEHILT